MVGGDLGGLMFGASDLELDFWNRKDLEAVEYDTELRTSSG